MTEGQELMTEKRTNPFLAAIWATGGSPQAAVASIRKLTPDTVADARGKAKALIAENRAWFQYKLTQPSSLLYKLTGHGVYSLHIKYANRKLKGWCEDDFDEYEDVQHEDMLQMFDALNWSIDNGECDAALQAVIDDIARMRKSKTA